MHSRAILLSVCVAGLYVFANVLTEKSLTPGKEHYMAYVCVIAVVAFLGFRWCCQQFGLGVASAVVDSLLTLLTVAYAIIILKDRLTAIQYVGVLLLLLGLLLVKGPWSGTVAETPREQAGSACQSQQYNDFANWTRHYLETYYRCDPTIDEIAINRFINHELGRLNRDWQNYVEISGEGGVHHMISFAPRVKKLFSTDFRDEARAESLKWATGASDAFRWDHYVAMALKHEEIDPTEQNIGLRIAQMRQKIERIDTCNVLGTPIVDTSKIPLTPDTITGMFFVSGEVGENINGWERVMKNVCDSIAPGGHLFMSALRGMQEYVVHQPDGSDKTYPCAELYGHHFRGLLPRLGFSNPVVEEFEIPNPDVGLKGIIMVSATKLSA